MYGGGSGPHLEDALLNDQLLFEYSPAESLINFELPTLFDAEVNDVQFSDLDFHCDAFVGSATDVNKDDSMTCDSSPMFDFADLDKSIIDEYLLEALSSDVSNDIPQSSTDSTESGDDATGRFSVLGTELDIMCLQEPVCTSTTPQNTDWSQNTRKLQEVEKIDTKIRSWGEPKFCSELGAFRCPVEDCGKLYAKASHVRAHLRRHSGEKPYKCLWGDCAWRFARSDELARHRRSHSGDKPYPCRECGKKFARSDHLAKHGRVHARRAAAAAVAAARRAAGATHTHRTRRLL